MALLVYRAHVRAGFNAVKAAHDDLAGEALQPAYDGEDYASFARQVAHDSDREQGELFRRILTALYLAFHLELAGYFPERSGDFFAADNEDLITECLAVAMNLMSCSCNAYEVSELYKTDDPAQGGGPCTRELGGAVYPTVSLSNHGCVANTMR